MRTPGKAPVVTGEWECTECGLAEEGTIDQRPPKCPECGAPAQALEFHAEEDEWEEVDEDEDDEEDLFGDGDDLDDDYDDGDGEDFDDDEDY